MNPSPRSIALRRALLVLRLSLGAFLLQWGLEKLLLPASTIGIWGYFYGITVNASASYAFGAVELALAACLVLGFQKTLAYGAATLLHGASVAVSWRQLLDPWGAQANHLFIAGVPVLGAFVALLLLRHWDRGVFEPALLGDRAAAPAMPAGTEP